jgi:arylsulfatase A-like enzyme
LLLITVLTAGSASAYALAAAGYRTAMMGKYLNGYDPQSNPPEPGCSLWEVAGNGYPQFHYDFNDNGKFLLADGDMAQIDADFRKRAQSVQAVDKMIGELEDAVAAIGEANTTYFVFSSDNGYHVGEHRMMQGKMTAFDTDIHVPLVVTGPGIAPGHVVQEIADNIDLNPTFTEIGGAATAANVDGRSLVPLLHGRPVAEWRKAALVEHHGHLTDASDPDFPRQARRQSAQL